MGTAFADDVQDLQNVLAKIVFAHQLQVLFHLQAESSGKYTAETLNARLSQEALQLTAVDVSSGSYPTITGASLSSFVTVPDNGAVLRIGLGPLNATIDGVAASEILADVHWGQPGPGLQPGSLSVGKAFALEPQVSTCRHYLNPTLRATYKGQTVQWRALYLTGCPDHVHGVDPVLHDALVKFWTADVYPAVTLKQHLTDAAKQWLRDNSSPSAPKGYVSRAAKR